MLHCRKLKNGIAIVLSSTDQHVTHQGSGISERTLSRSSPKQLSCHSKQVQSSKGASADVERKALPLVLSLKWCSVQMAATREAVPSPMDLPDKLSAKTRPVRLS